MAADFNQIIKSDAPTLVLVAQKDGSIRVTSSSFENYRSVLAGQQLTVVWVESKCLVTIGPLPALPWVQALPLVEAPRLADWDDVDAADKVKP